MQIQLIMFSRCIDSAETTVFDPSAEKEPTDIVALFWCNIQRQSTSGKKMVLTVKAELKLFTDKHLNMQLEQMRLWRETHWQIMFCYLAFARILKLLVQITSMFS